MLAGVRGCVFAGVRVNEEGVPEDEENFDEAVTHVNAAFMPTVVNTPSTLLACFDHHS